MRGCTICLKILQIRGRIYCSKAANDIIMKRMPADTTMDCLIFHGAPDLIVNLKPVVLLGVDVIYEDGCIEDKDDESLPYEPASIIPDQAG